ncbi:unnamed protein product [Brassica napus]|uniref:(rape) hypothetical protein n=1 Tax=Brassica napus TaxID=3708 RepID=A0A816U6K8_BRANA|nr:unnamed protein product [Brassica napus]
MGFLCSSKSSKGRRYGCVCECIGIGYHTFCDIKSSFPELGAPQHQPPCLFQGHRQSNALKACGLDVRYESEEGARI